MCVYIYDKNNLQENIADNILENWSIYYLYKVGFVEKKRIFYDVGL